MKRAGLILGFLLLAGFGITSVRLIDVKWNGARLNVFTPESKQMKYIDFEGGNCSYSKSTQQLTCYAPAFDPDLGAVYAKNAQVTGSAYASHFNFIVSASPSPTPGAGCNEEADTTYYPGGSGVNGTLMICEKNSGGTKVVGRIF